MKRITLYFAGFLSVAIVIAVTCLMIVYLYDIEWNDDDESVVGLFFIMVWWISTSLFGNITMAVLAELKGKSVSNICYRFNQIWFCTPFLVVLVCICAIPQNFAPAITLAVVLCFVSGFAAAICYALKREEEIG